MCAHSSHALHFHKVILFVLFADGGDRGSEKIFKRTLFTRKAWGVCPFKPRGFQASNSSAVDLDYIPLGSSQSRRLRDEMFDVVEAELRVVARADGDRDVCAIEFVLGVESGCVVDKHWVLGQDDAEQLLVNAAENQHLALDRIICWKDTSFDPLVHGQVFGPEIEEADAAFECEVLTVALGEFKALDAVNGKHNLHFHGPFGSAGSVCTFHCLCKPILGLRGENALSSLRAEHGCGVLCLGSGCYIELGFPEIECYLA